MSEQTKEKIFQGVLSLAQQGVPLYEVKVPVSYTHLPRKGWKRRRRPINSWKAANSAQRQASAVVRLSWRQRSSR